MATMWFEGIEDLYEVAGTIATSTGRVGERASAVLRKTALDIEGTAKAFCPVDTGNLRNSIGTTVTGDGRYGAMEAEIGTDVEYAVFQEYGTSRMAPQAFLGPALDRHSGEFLAALARLNNPLA